MARTPDTLSRRERQIMDALYRLGRATANEVIRAVGDPSAQTSIRKLLRILEQKGHVVHERVGREHIYRPRVPRGRARKVAVRSLLETFFAGSPDDAVAAILNDARDGLDDAQLERLKTLIEEAKKEGR